MSTWTRLVGDPVLSKWIVVFLAISISLNGYLLKGIAAGLVLPRLRRGSVGVRFEGGEEGEDEVPAVLVKEEEVKGSALVRVERPLLFPILPPAPLVVAPRPVVAPAPAPPSPTSAPAMPTFTLEDVDRRLQASRMLLTPPSSTSGESAVDEQRVRTLEECIDVFENGPRPLSTSLALLNDEEVILLAQNGKIAAYALEKVLGMEHLERAVRVRRALVCTFFPFFLSS